MKKFFSLILALASMATNAHADGMTATLQQGDKMTPYYGIGAFQQAYAAAADSGAVITLSPGAFTPVTAISKSITIIGTYGLSSTSSTSTIQTDVTISANNVTLEGIYFSGTVTLGNVSNCHIKRCYIYTELNATANHFNTRIDQSVIMTDNAVAKGYNYSINNSTIHSFNSKNTTSNKAYIANCFIWVWNYKPYGTYINNVLGFLSGSSSSTSNLSYTLDVASEFYNNVFYGFRTLGTWSGRLTVTFPEGCINRGNTIKNETAQVTLTYPNTTSNWGTGVDGTPIGTTGGQGFVAYPGIPRITSSTIDSHTDASGKINVKVSVAVPE